MTSNSENIVSNELFPTILNNRVSEILNHFSNLLSDPNPEKMLLDNAQIKDIIEKHRNGAIKSDNIKWLVIRLFNYIKSKHHEGIPGSLIEYLADEKKKCGLDPAKHEKYTEHEALVLSGILQIAQLGPQSPSPTMNLNFNSIFYHDKDIDGLSAHFGSFSFHTTGQPEKKESLFNFNFSALFDKERQKNQNELEKHIIQTLETNVIGVITKTVENAGNIASLNPICKHLFERYTKMAGSFRSNHDICADITAAWKEAKEGGSQGIFQFFTSNVITRRQNRFLVDIDSYVPMILSRVQVVDSKEKQPILDPLVLFPNKDCPNYIELSGTLEDIAHEFLDKCLLCAKFGDKRKDGKEKDKFCIDPQAWNSENVECNNCRLFENVDPVKKKKWKFFVLEIYKFINTFMGKYPIQEKSEGGEDKSVCLNRTSWPVCRLIELIFPFIYLGRPIVISSQSSYSSKSDASGTRRSISCSITSDPRVEIAQSESGEKIEINFPAGQFSIVEKYEDNQGEEKYLPQVETRELRKWTAIVSNAFHDLVRRVGNSFIELDRYMAEKNTIEQKTEASLIPKWAHGQRGTLFAMQTILRATMNLINDVETKGHISECLGFIRQAYDNVNLLQESGSYYRSLSERSPRWRKELERVYPEDSKTPISDVILKGMCTGLLRLFAVKPDEQDYRYLKAFNKFFNMRLLGKYDNQPPDKVREEVLKKGFDLNKVLATLQKRGISYAELQKNKTFELTAIGIEKEIIDDLGSLYVPPDGKEFIDSGHKSTIESAIRLTVEKTILNYVKHSNVEKSGHDVALRIFADAIKSSGTLYRVRLLFLNAAREPETQSADSSDKGNVMTEGSIGSGILLCDYLLKSLGGCAICYRSLNNNDKIAFHSRWGKKVNIDNIWDFWFAMELDIPGSKPS